MSTSTMPLLGMVEEGVYRSGSIAILPQKIRTILLLSSELSKQSLAGLDKKLIHIESAGSGPPKLNTPGSWRPVSDEMIKEGLEVVLNADHYPLLVMCSSGSFETGALIGCLRKMQGWNFNSIVVEYRSYAGPKSKYDVEQFIELFDTDLVVLPPNLPAWFKSYLELEVQS